MATWSAASAKVWSSAYIWYIQLLYQLDHKTVPKGDFSGNRANPSH